jgi:hypothetical protein
MPVRLEIIDTPDDTVVRRIDVGADGAVDVNAHRPPDILVTHLGRWSPDAPHLDLFVGQWLNSGEFFRLDVVFKGLINPGGPLGFPGEPFDPFIFGPNPLYGFIEIDMDNNVDTGGELATPQFRYLGNAARFGGMPTPLRFTGRAAVDNLAFDGNIQTMPWVERSGEEFHIAFLGLAQHLQQLIRIDDLNNTFDPGDRWILVGRFFHRAHGYEPFSLACCQAPLGSYEPVVRIQFAHSIVDNRTTLSLVYPLTQVGSALMNDTGVTEPPDGDATNQNSVHEGLEDLYVSATFATPSDRGHPDFVLIAPWQDQQPGDYLVPQQWKVTSLVATSYTLSQGGPMAVWSDICPDVVIGDFNGDGQVRAGDQMIFDLFLANHDGNVDADGDGVADGRMIISNFGPNFSLFDTNYDGVVDAEDRPQLQDDPFNPADFDLDGDVDHVDFARLQRCLGGEPMALPATCRTVDLNGDFNIASADVDLFRACVSGPSVPAEPTCTLPVPPE